MPPQGSHLAAPLGGRLGGLRFHVAAWQRESTATRRKGVPWTMRLTNLKRLIQLMDKFMHHLGCSKSHTKPM